jgi:CxxC motif-containing protein (DUF1111 family)
MTSPSKFFRMGMIALAAGALASLTVQLIGCTSTAVPPPAAKAECFATLGNLPGPTTAPATRPTNNGAFADTFDEDMDAFAELEDSNTDGLGPVYNANSCAACHQTTAVGQTSQISVLRAGHLEHGRFYEPPGGSLIFQRAIHPDIQVHVQALDNIRTLRMTTNILGDGFIECVADQDIFDRQAAQPAGMKGTIVLNPVPVRLGANNKFEFVERVGRFGWKSQDASLLAFSAGAYLNEMGITSPLQPTENSSLGRDTAPYNPMLPHKPVQDPDPPFGKDVAAFARFMRGTNPPPRAQNMDTAKVARGLEVFKSIQCAVCHVPQWTTVPAGTVLEDLTVPDALGGKTFEPFSDFMLHDVGTGDGIVQTQHAQRPPKDCEVAAVKPVALGKAVDPQSQPHVHRVLVDMYKYVDDDKNPQKGAYRTGTLGQRYMDSGLVETAQMIRTAPLWGLRARPQLMHDGLSLTVDEAVRRHAKQAQSSTQAYGNLSAEDRCALLTFLMSL